MLRHGLAAQMTHAVSGTDAVEEWCPIHTEEATRSGSVVSVVVRNRVMWCAWRLPECRARKLFLQVEAPWGAACFPGSQGVRGSIHLSSTTAALLEPWLVKTMSSRQRQ